MSELGPLLQELEAAWTRRGLDLSTRHNPGLPREITAQTLDAAGLPAPTEILDWYAWHNGAVGAPGNTIDNMICLAPTGWEAQPLAEALSARATFLDDSRREVDFYRASGSWELISQATDDPEHWLWEEGWLPIAYLGPPMSLVVDVTADPDLCPVRRVEWQYDDFREIQSDSMATMVAGWIEMLDTYEGKWNPLANLWQVTGPIPPEMRRRAVFY